MFKSVSRFSVYVGPIFIVFASLTLMGCPKKVSSVSGSSGVTNDGRTSADSSSPSRDSTSRGDSSGDIRQDEIASTRRGDSSSRGGDSSSDDRSPDFGGQSQSERRGMADGGMSDERLSFNKNVYFDYDRAIVRQDAKDLLKNNARWLALNSGVKIRIEGHGDERGTNDYNLALGERRARSIVRYLVNLGIRESRFSFISFGEERSICREKTEACYQKNRRAHFLVKN